ncbi:MAG: M20/M25/M40 family metallo-hydrolase [Oscillospiraceae bacterium]|nr:M20/M25/M40 family metallo-hydrolase [Oscillospiraceae bacterium]
MEIKKLLEKFSHIVSPSGYEYMAEPDITKIINDDFKGVFDEVYFDKFGSCHLIKKAAPEIENQKKIMFDAHIDQIGLIVSEILDGGFLRVNSLGGLDLNILPASEFFVYTYDENNEPFIFANNPERKIPAIAVSVPPHLKKTYDSSNNLPKLEDIYLDTGYDSKEELEKIIKIGSPVTFKQNFTNLENNLVSCAGMDDKLCAAVLMLAAKSIKNPDMINAEIHIVLSVSEETKQFGAATAAFEIQPDFAIVLDVGLSRDPGVDASEAFEISKGAGISYSAETNIKLTKNIITLAKDKKIPVQIIAEPTGTGTNAESIQITGEGIPCVLISVPLKNMHTFNEICSIKDIGATVELVREIMENGGTVND